MPQFTSWAYANYVAQSAGRHRLAWRIERNGRVFYYGREEVAAGYIGISPPGVKRVVLGLEDTLFVTVHLNKDDTRDIAAIEAEHIEPETLVIETIVAQEMLS